MPRREYQDSLTELRADVEDLGTLATERVEQALTALDTGDRDAAEGIIDGDDDINRRYLELEQACIDLFALQQPVASDLRFIAASFKILTDIERIGDLATNFARYTAAENRHRDFRIDVVEIGTDAHDLVADALDAYARKDAEMCYEIAARDDEIDTLCQSASERVVRGLIEQGATGDDPWSAEQVMDDVSRLLLTIRDIERVADHGVNIAARTLYMVENDPELIY